MPTPWLATIGAVLPLTLVGWRPAHERHRRQRARGAGTSASSTTLRPPAAVPETSARISNDDPFGVIVVPFIPSRGADPERRPHPRIRNPFRAFPHRGAHLVALIDGRARRA